MIYALSNGTVPEAGRPGGEIAALGTSPDRGRTWEWRELPEVPPGTSIAMFRADGSTIVATGRPGRPEQYEAIQVARDAWLDIDEDLPLWDVDESSISYIDDAKIDAGDPCAVLHERLDYFSLVAAGQRLRTGAQELDAVVAALNREAEGFDLDLAAAGCIIDRDTIESFPQVITVTWDELGVQIPESWTSSFDLFQDQGGSLIRLDSPLDGKPLDRFHTEDGRLEVVTLEAATGPGHRSLWTTSDGVTWDRETMTESELSIQGDVEPPVAGNSTFRVDWSGQRADSGVPQRSVAGGPWEDLDLDELAPGLDFSDHVFVVRGTDYGVFLLARFETASLIVLYSSNGIDWGTFETTGNELELHQIGDTIVAFDQYPVVTELGEGINARVLLLRPQS